MEMSKPTATPPVSHRLSDRAFDALAVAFAFVSYFSVFVIVRRHGSIGDAALSSLMNLLPLLVVAVAARAAIRRYAIGAKSVRQVALHLVLAPAFSILWYWLIMVLMGVRAGGSFVEFAVRAFFPGPVFAWQLLQGLAAYALVAALTYLRAQGELPSFVMPAAGEAQEPTLTRYFIRCGDDIYPVDVDQIVSIMGADDYAEVATREGRHLVRTTLSEFEAALDANRFARVHRSHIVNLDCVVRAEPSGGGRMLLHLVNGEMVQTSRSGAKLLRSRVI